MRITTVWTLGVFLFLATTAQAQTISSYGLSIYNAGAPTPLSAPTVLLAANVTCNQAPPTPAVNPTKIFWDDSVNVGKVCLWVDPGTGPLSSVPFGGSYEATLTATNSAGTSPESNRASFSRPGQAPIAPSGLRAGK